MAKKITSIAASTIQQVGNHLENEGKYKDLSVDDCVVFDLLKQVNTIAACIPGSQASKIYVRNEIRNYFAYFGLPHIYFTFNPSAAHSPLFQLMYGDTTVDLSS